MDKIKGGAVEMRTPSLLWRKEKGRGGGGKG